MYVFMSVCVCIEHCTLLYSMWRTRKAPGKGDGAGRLVRTGRRVFLEPLSILRDRQTAPRLHGARHDPLRVHLLPRRWNFSARAGGDLSIYLSLSPYKYMYLYTFTRCEAELKRIFLKVRLETFIILYYYYTHSVLIKFHSHKRVCLFIIMIITITGFFFFFVTIFYTINDFWTSKHSKL